MIDIKFDQLNGETKLEDGDVIAVQVTENATDPAHIRIGLQLGPGVFWWKGIQLDEIIVCQCQDSQNYSVSQVSYQVFKDRNLNLWKAKAFGAHTPMYTITDSVQKMKAGNQYLFEWLKD